MGTLRLGELRVEGELVPNKIKTKGVRGFLSRIFSSGNNYFIL
jgi:hypothetical protein